MDLVGNKTTNAPPVSSPIEKKITYHEDIAPILRKHCMSCHSEGNAGPFTLTSYDDAVDMMKTGLQEIKARRGPVIAIASPDDREVASVADDVIPIPDVPEWLQPIVAAIPLQLLAYEISLLRGCDVDKPRNLAKSVTVE
jgi:glucosamine--fructose-6-phosphate aminotransferase (isomerizing)